VSAVDTRAPDAHTLSSPNRRDAHQRWKRRGLLALAILIYEIIWVITAFDLVNPTDLDIFFFPAVRIALAGHPLDIYQLRVGLIYPNANGPLGLLPVLLASWIASLRGWLLDPVLRRALLFAVTAPFPLLAAWEAARAVERFGGRTCKWAWLLPYLTMLFAPELWLSALYYGHIEQIIAVWMVLAAIRMLSERRQIAAGALLGLALLARSDVTLIILPIALTLLARRQFSATARLAAGGAITVSAGLAPFLIADQSDTIFSLVTYRPALGVGGGNIWSLSDAPQFLAIGQQYDSALAIGLVLLLTLAFLAFKRDLTVASPDFYLLLALTSLCFALLIKTLWPYYYQEAALLATVWALARLARPLAAQRRPWSALAGPMVIVWLPRLAILACALLAEYSLEMTNYGGWQHPWGIIEGSACVMIFALTLIWLAGAPRLLALLLEERQAHQAPPGDILPEIALSAPTDGGS
jgi:hypothetical protein